MYVFSTWSSFFGQGLDSPTIANKTFYQLNEPYTPEELEIWVFNCFFLDISHQGQGAALFYNQSGKILVESCTFVTCSVTGYDATGASIYVQNADCALNQVCGLHCNTDKDASFSYVVNQGKTHNYIQQTSVALCFASYYNTMQHWYGYIKVKSLNSSYNKASERPGLECAPNVLIDVYGTSISASSFANNTSTQYCVVLSNAYNSNCQHGIKNTNIIDNRGKSTILSMGITTLMKSSVMNNDDPQFHTYHSEGSIFILIECSVDNITEEGPGSVDSSSIGENVFTNSLPFPTNENCIYTPAKTPFETPENTPTPSPMMTLDYGYNLITIKYAWEMIRYCLTLNDLPE